MKMTRLLAELVVFFSFSYLVFTVEFFRGAFNHISSRDYQALIIGGVMIVWATVIWLFVKANAVLMETKIYRYGSTARKS